ncbi:hypothetical protein IWQ62_005089 [Dispira parvispora]|uniref:Secreted protein n=1 Tax=Dispira parvispora TaxID=1520584 RepID=A0A9W8E514_9FUNG|nr:hypothetical protein IWQ62_005089 [Dispira parvispora]
MVACSTIWCVLLVIAFPMEVLSSGSPSDGRKVMKIDFLCGNDAEHCTSPTYPPSENSYMEAMDMGRTHSGANTDSGTRNPAADDNSPDTSVNLQRKRRFSVDETHHPSSYEDVDGATTSTDAKHDPRANTGTSSASSSNSAVMQAKDTADGRNANIPSDSEIQERVDGILRGEVEEMSGKYFNPTHSLQKTVKAYYNNFKLRCNKKISNAAAIRLTRDLENRISNILENLAFKLSNDRRGSTTLWFENGGELVTDVKINGYIGNDNIIGMVYQEIGEKELQAKFILIPNVPGYDCGYFKKHFDRRYDFVYGFALPLGMDPRVTMTTFLKRFAEYKKTVNSAMAA